MAIVNRAALGGGKGNRVIVAIYGAGKSTISAGNIQLKRIIKTMGGRKPFNHGADDEIYDYIATQYQRKNNPNIVLIGYSMGGACAVRVANNLSRDSIKLDTLLTIDPVPLSFSMRPKTLLLKSTRAGVDVKNAVNFFQHSVRQTGAFGGRWMNGENPYWGSKVATASGSKTVLKQTNLTANTWIKNFDDSVITHLNIVERVLG